MALDIAIVGAGVAGLCAAVAFRQGGHSVRIFEKSQFASEIGAALTIAPNGARVLSALGFSFDRARASATDFWQSINGINFKLLTFQDFTKLEDQEGEPLRTVHRVDLHNELLRLACDGENPVTLSLSSAVRDVDVKNGILKLSDNTTHKADLIVGADGVHSTVRQFVLGPEGGAAGATDMSAFRMLVPENKFREIQDIEKLLQWKSGVTIFADTIDQEHERHLVWYVCQEGEVHNIVGIHPTRSDASTETNFKKSLLNEFRYFHPEVLKILEVVENVKCWQLEYFEPFQTWTLGRAVLIGDAAHPMLPFGGQAANQAIEDGAALGYLLQGVTDVENIQKRLRIFEEIKRRRTAIIQILSSTRIGEEATVTEKLWQYAEPGATKVPTTFAERTAHTYRFDILKACEEALQSLQ